VNQNLSVHRYMNKAKDAAGVPEFRSGKIVCGSTR
jgi:hypothetical protein